MRLRPLAAGAVLLVLAACGSPAASPSTATADTPEPAASSSAAAAPEWAADLDGRRIGVIYLNQTSPFQQTFAQHFQMYAETYNFELLERDGQQDAAVQADLMEELILQDVDGIIIQPIDGAAIVPMVLDAQERDIAVVMNALRLGEGAHAPFAGIEEGVVSERLGVAAVEYFRRHFGEDVVPKVIVVDCPVSTASPPRAVGFLAGLVEAAPEADFLAQIDGGCAQDAAVTAMEDALQVHRDVNMVYGVNSANALGALAALQSAGLGSPDNVLVLSHAGSEPEVLEIANPESAMKMAAGTSPRGLVEINLETLAGVFSGEIAPDEDSDHLMEESILSADDRDGLVRWMEEELLSDTPLP